MSSTELVPWVRLGKSGLKISNVIVGCMSYGSKEWVPWVEDDEEKIFKILKKAYDHGIRTFDTADIYSNGLSEVLLGRFLKKFNIKRDKVVIFSKVFAPVDDSYGPGFSFINKEPTAEQNIDFQNNRGLSRRHIIDAAENSVKRLGTYMDVYQIHRFDPEVTQEETMKALNDVVEKGLTRYIGASLMKAVDFVEYQHIAEKNGWHKFINVQSYYNLLNREDENELNYYCLKNGVGITPYSPLDRGALAKPIPKDLEEYTDRQKTAGISSAIYSPTEPKHAMECEIINRVGEIAEKKKVPRAAVATAWLIHKGSVPIVGLSSEKRVEELVIGANLKLEADEVEYLESPYEPRKRQI